MSQTLRLRWGDSTYPKLQNAELSWIAHCINATSKVAFFQQFKFWLSRTSCLKDSPSLPKRRASGLKSRHKRFQCLPGLLIVLCGRVQVVARHVNGHVNEIRLATAKHSQKLKHRQCIKLTTLQESFLCATSGKKYQTFCGIKSFR